MAMTETDLERMYPGLRGWLDENEWRLFLATYSSNDHLSKQLTLDEELRKEMWRGVMEKLERWRIGRRGHGYGSTHRC